MISMRQSVTKSQVLRLIPWFSSFLRSTQKPQRGESSHQQTLLWDAYQLHAHAGKKKRVPSLNLHHTLWNPGSQGQRYYGSIQRRPNSCSLRPFQLLILIAHALVQIHRETNGGHRDRPSVHKHLLWQRTPKCSALSPVLYGHSNWVPLSTRIWWRWSWASGERQDDRVQMACTVYLPWKRCCSPGNGWENAEAFV